jgi:hypothetical protein
VFAELSEKWLVAKRERATQLYDQWEQGAAPRENERALERNVSIAKL